MEENLSSFGETLIKGKTLIKLLKRFEMKL